MKKPIRIAVFVALSSIVLIGLVASNHEILVSANIKGNEKVLNLECPNDTIEIGFGKVTRYDEDDSRRSYNGEEFTAKIYFNGQFVKAVGKEIFESSYRVTIPHADLVGAVQLESGDWPIEVRIRKNAVFGWLQKSETTSKLVQVRNPGEVYLSKVDKSVKYCCRYTCLKFANEPNVFFDEGAKTKLNYRLKTTIDRTQDEVITHWDFEDVHYEHFNGTIPIPAVRKSYSEPALFWRQKQLAESNVHSYAMKIKQSGNNNPRLKITEISYDVNYFELNCDTEDQLVDVKTFTKPNYFDHFMDLNCTNPELQL